MKFVLDASVAVKGVLPEEGSDKAIALQEAFENAVHELLAPDVLPIEVAHALTRAERRRRASESTIASTSPSPRGSNAAWYRPMNGS